MSTSESDPAGLTPAYQDLPRFELDFAVDDRLEPTSVTIFRPMADDVTTNWITIDATFAVDLADVA